MITKEKLKKMIAYVRQFENEYVEAAGNDLLPALQELLTLQEQNKELLNKEDGYALLISNANDNVVRLEAYADKLEEQNAELLADGERLANQLRAEYNNEDHLPGVVALHEELMEKYG